MGKFRKKPVVIEAVQWTGENARAVHDFAGTRFGKVDAGNITVMSPEGAVTGTVGYWVIRGVKGEYYLCAPDIFAATYEPVDAQEGQP